MSDSNNIRSGAKKILMSIFTQAIILVISVITGFILPQKMGPDNYGYWQIYVFYLSYLNLFGLGFNDGFALFYGGYEYENLPFKKIRSAMKIIYVYLIAVTVILFTFTLFVDDEIRQYIYKCLVLSIPLSCMLCIILTVFLSVNKTEIYNVVNLLTKFLAVSFYLILLYFGIVGAEPMMTADLFSRLIVVAICIFLGRDFLFGKSAPIKEGFNEFLEKSAAGINITFAIIASTLIPVSGRIVIEFNESIETYGIYSFAMSLLVIIMAFTTTAGTVAFPMLKKFNEKSLPKYYSKLSFACDSMISIALFAYIPLVFIIQNIMTKYISSLDYLYILLAMCIPLGKMQLLITSYYKVFRMEKAFLVANIIGVISMIGLTIITYSLFESIIEIAICTTLVLTIWTFATELYLVKKVDIPISYKDFKGSLIIMISFLFAASFKNPVTFIMIYLPVTLLQFLTNRENVSAFIKSINRKIED